MNIDVATVPSQYHCIAKLNATQYLRSWRLMHAFKPTSLLWSEIAQSIRVNVRLPNPVKVSCTPRAQSLASTHDITSRTLTQKPGNVLDLNITSHPRDRHDVLQHQVLGFLLDQPRQ